MIARLSHTVIVPWFKAGTLPVGENASMRALVSSRYIGMTVSLNGMPSAFSST